MHRAVLRFLPVLFFLSFSGTAGAQSPTPSPSATPTAAPPPCPTVNVQPRSVGRRTRDGDRVQFSANINGGDPKVVPTIIWSTSAGVITQGQSTRQIEVDTTGAGSTPDRELRAEIWVGGYAPACMLQARASVPIVPPAVRLGEFGEVDEETLKKNLEQVSTYLAQTPDNLFLIAYAGRNSERGYAYNWLARVKESLVVKGIAPRRIVGIDGGFREEPHFDFWIVPSGADPPRPAPTVKRSEIVYPNTRPARKP